MQTTVKFLPFLLDDVAEFFCILHITCKYLNLTAVVIYNILTFVQLYWILREGQIVTYVDAHKEAIRNNKSKRYFHFIHSSISEKNFSGKTLSKAINSQKSPASSSLIIILMVILLVFMIKFLMENLNCALKRAVKLVQRYSFSRSTSIIGCKRQVKSEYFKLSLDEKFKEFPDISLIYKVSF
ncbi:CLUMA_CG006960, isoform A [Clunio marinus]|uniref:CLUMA_CG006960, isoform A n=1 Tax=Clunio marinus TaxID=568069 RepID=A0A1J1HZ95_9DIPT|nr:CLUMA_CG006960, isoform A [Clunio marinus]